ncbi:hypothetical protein C1645_737503 [Glomus cerebriforme]|uniref:Uncharacterized protein n=1 Tax=Glomus cerebriforme TaxID=658196 RepID=A0A397SXH9_9GLOM|nr:hypothetical protein C1645_737503 [Glomus cerebriforme]
MSIPPNINSILDINEEIEDLDGVGHVWEGVEDDNTIPDMIIIASWMLSEKCIYRINDGIVIDMGHTRALLKKLVIVGDNCLFTWHDKSDEIGFIQIKGQKEMINSLRYYV